MALMAVADALERVLARAAPLPAEAAPLAEAHGRVLADDVAARRTQPPANVSAMDGYAVRAADVAAVPRKLKLVGEVAAGHPFAGTIGPGEAARIFTGGVLPEGTDTIVIQENTRRDGDSVTVTTPETRKGRHVRYAGLDFKQGDALLPKGRRLSA
ncbi:MAG: molybdopterin molybdenumtransferase MoeA, partial [Xanthobacteraceae bacterium]